MKYINYNSISERLFKISDVEIENSGKIEIKFGKNQKLPIGYFITTNLERSCYVVENIKGYQSCDYKNRYDAYNAAWEHFKKA
jgi:hypothetical protein